MRYAESDERYHCDTMPPPVDQHLLLLTPRLTILLHSRQNGWMATSDIELADCILSIHPSDVGALVSESWYSSHTLRFVTNHLFSALPCETT